MEKHKLRLSLEEKLEAALKKADEVNEENNKLREQAQHGRQVEESGICFTYPELEDKADDGDRSFPPQDVRKQKTDQRAPAVSKGKVQPRSVVVDTRKKKADFHQSRRSAAPGGSDQ